MKISKEQELKELKESLIHIEHYLEIIKDENSYIKPLSVELRKLFCEGRGNELLKRIEKSYDTSISFPIRVKEPLMPPTYRNGTIDEYLNEFRFFQDGRDYTRKDIIKLIADKKGAHLDIEEKSFHQFEKNTYLPVYDNNVGGVYPLATKYLIDIGAQTIRICENIPFSESQNIAN